MRLFVYVPNLRTTELTTGHTRGIDPKSAIVGEGVFDEKIRIYYEGNRFRSSNVENFCDKAMIAGYRCVERYPTIAQRYVHPHAVIPVGQLDLDTRRIEIGHDGLRAMLAQYLAVEDHELDAQLRTSEAFGRF